MRNSPFWLVLIGLLILLDFYVFQALKVVSQSGEPKTRTIIYIVYWAVSILVLVGFLVVPYLNFDHFPKHFRSVLFALLIAVFFGKLITSVFLAVDDVRGDIYAGTDFGPLLLKKGSGSWELAGVGFPEALMVDLEFVPSQRVLVAATHGLGIFYLRLDP